MPSFSETLFLCLGIKSAKDCVAQSSSGKQSDIHTSFIKHFLHQTLEMSAVNGTNSVGTSAGGRFIPLIAYDLTNNVLRPSPD
jgi:hypothetical protein